MDRIDVMRMEILYYLGGMGMLVEKDVLEREKYDGFSLDMK